MRRFRKFLQKNAPNPFTNRILSNIIIPMTVIGKIRSRSLTREVPPWAGSGVGDSDGCAPVSWNGEVSLWRDEYPFPENPRYGSMSEKAKWNRDHSPLCPPRGQWAIFLLLCNSRAIKGASYDPQHYFIDPQSALHPQGRGDAR